MIKDLKHIYTFLEGLLRHYQAVLYLDTSKADQISAKGTIAAMQGRKKVDGFYVATIMMKPKDVRLYFFPIYTHKEQIAPLLNDELKVFLKGKSCFHIKYLNDTIQENLKLLFEEGICLYQQQGLLNH
jgi:hypothetical protein